MWKLSGQLVSAVVLVGIPAWADQVDSDASSQDKSTQTAASDTKSDQVLVDEDSDQKAVADSEQSQGGGSDETTYVLGPDEIVLTNNRFPVR